MVVSLPGERLLSVEEYLDFEEASSERHEYFNGQIYAMAGASPEHELIVMNLGTALNTRLRGRCRVYGSNLRVIVTETGLYTYPDLSVVCEDAQYEETRPPSLLNPLVLVEVLSESTGAYDRGEKFRHYQRLPSLREVLFVWQDRMRVERFLRQEEENTWILTAITGSSGSISLESLQIEVPMDEIYHQVALPSPGRPALVRPQYGDNAG